MCSRSKHHRLAVRIPEILAGHLGVSLDDVEVRLDDTSGADFVIEAAGQTLVVEFIKSTSAALISAAARKLQGCAKRLRPNAVPLVAVPFMGNAGRRACDEAGVGWLDLSGNARIVAGGTRIIIAGRPNCFRSVGRPPNLFAPKSSRIVRWLLMHSERSITQREIARATAMDEGFVSRIVSRLERDGYIVRDSGRAVRSRDPALLLEAWREAYMFSKHAVHQGHVASRSGDALLRFVCDTLQVQQVGHAATGLAAAWVYLHFATFRIVTVYLSSDPSPMLLEQLGCREDPRGANLWLVVPNDEGVFHGALEKDGICCVHPVQAYLDLKDHPERAPETADRLRGEFLNWRRDG
jgi:hypothetical protein